MTEQRAQDLLRMYFKLTFQRISEILGASHNMSDEEVKLLRLRIKDEWTYGSFQRKLKEFGYVQLPSLEPSSLNVWTLVAVRDCGVCGSCNPPDCVPCVNCGAKFTYAGYLVSGVPVKTASVQLPVIVHLLR